MRWHISIPPSVCSHKVKNSLRYVPTLLPITVASRRAGSSYHPYHSKSQPDTLLLV